MVETLALGSVGRSTYSEKLLSKVEHLGKREKRRVKGRGRMFLTIPIKR